MLVSWCHHVAVFPVNGGIGNVWFSVWLSAAADPSHSITHGAHEQLSVGCTARFSVLPEVSDGTKSARVLLQTRCSWCSAGVLEGSVTWSHLSVSPPFVALLYLVLLVSLAA